MTRTLKEGRMTAPTLLWNPKFPIHLWKQMLPPSAAVEVTNVSPLAFHLVFFSSLAYSHSNRGRSVILVSVWVLCCMGVWSVRRENGGSWKERHFFSCYDRRWSAVSSAQFAGVILFFFFFFKVISIYSWAEIQTFLFKSVSVPHAEQPGCWRHQKHHIFFFFYPSEVVLALNHPSNRFTAQFDVELTKQTGWWTWNITSPESCTGWSKM